MCSARGTIACNCLQQHVSTMASSFHQLSVANVQNLIAWWKTLLPCISWPGAGPWPMAGWLKMQLNAAEKATTESQIADCLFHFVAVHLVLAP